MKTSPERQVPCIKNGCFCSFHPGMLVRPQGPFPMNASCPSLRKVKRFSTGPCPLGVFLDYAFGRSTPSEVGPPDRILSLAHKPRLQAPSASPEAPCCFFSGRLLQPWMKPQSSGCSAQVTLSWIAWASLNSYFASILNCHVAQRPAKGGTHD